MADPRIKQLKIKTGSVKRLTKEVEMYIKEAQQNETKVEQMQASGDEEAEYRTKKQREVLAETQQMIPDAQKRLKNYKDELQSFVDSEADLAESEEYKAAKEALQNAEKMLEA